MSRILRLQVKLEEIRSIRGINVFFKFLEQINRILRHLTVTFRSSGMVLEHNHVVVGYLARPFNAPFTGRFGV